MTSFRLREIKQTWLGDYRGKYHKPLIECRLECGHTVYRVDRTSLVPGNQCRCYECGNNKAKEGQHASQRTA